MSNALRIIASTCSSSYESFQALINQELESTEAEVANWLISLISLTNFCFFRNSNLSKMPKLLVSVLSEAENIFVAERH